jgi:hypothetical protein
VAETSWCDPFTRWLANKCFDVEMDILVMQNLPGLCRSCRAAMLRSLARRGDHAQLLQHAELVK